MKLTEQEAKGIGEFVQAATALLVHLRSGEYGPILTARVERLRVAYGELHTKVKNAT